MIMRHYKEQFQWPPAEYKVFRFTNGRKQIRVTKRSAWQNSTRIILSLGNRNVDKKVFSYIAASCVKLNLKRNLVTTIETESSYTL